MTLYFILFFLLSVSWALQLRVSVGGVDNDNGIVTLDWSRSGGDPAVFFIRVVKDSGEMSGVLDIPGSNSASVQSDAAPIPFNNVGKFEFQAFKSASQTSGFFSKSNQFEVDVASAQTDIEDGDDSAVTHLQLRQADVGDDGDDAVTGHSFGAMTIFPTLAASTSFPTTSTSTIFIIISTSSRSSSSQPVGTTSSISSAAPSQPVETTSTISSQVAANPTNTETDTQRPPSVTPSVQRNNQSTHSNASLIAGATIGGFAAIFLFGILVFFWRRRRAGRLSDEERHAIISPRRATAVQPFSVASPRVVREEKPSPVGERPAASPSHSVNELEQRMTSRPSQPIQNDPVRNVDNDAQREILSLRAELERLVVASNVEARSIPSEVPPPYVE
ncbi:hypothetical protein BDZ89DRAFT_1111903, partial [Hymenopellis radicata]